MAEQLCRRCKTAKATGIIFALCGPCFEEFSKLVEQRTQEGDRLHLSDAEAEYVNEPFFDRSRN